jgi:ComEC/Rec2-related protein
MHSKHILSLKNMLHQLIIRPFIPLSLLLSSIYIAVSNHAIIVTFLLFIILFSFLFYKGVTKSLLIFGLTFSILFMILSWIHRKNSHSPLEEKSNEIKTFNLSILNTKKYKTHDQLTGKIEYHGKEIKIICKLDSFLINQLYYGDKITCSGNLVEFKSASEFDNFDPKEYYENQHINFLLYSKVNSITYVETGKITFISSAQKCRDYCSKIISLHFPNLIHKSLMNGILLGIKQELPNDIVDAFKNTGTSHILAVSGMHLTYLYASILFILGKILKIKNQKKSVALTLFVIWLFTFITGAGAAVLRAAMMFSIIEIGKLLRRNNDVFNITFGAGFLMIIFNPCIIFDIGFQLSFLAVLSITLFNPIMLKLYSSNSTLKNKIWELVSITLAVQILTMPITMYYFHQFPSYFLIANIIWVPLSTILMYGGMVILALGVSNIFLIKYIASAICAFIDFGLYTFELLKGLPFYIIENIYLFKEQILLLYIFILFITFIIHTNKKLNYAFVFAFPVLFLLPNFIRSEISKREKEIIFFNLKNQDLFFIRNGREIISVGGSTNLASEPALNYRNRTQSKIIQHINVDSPYIHINHLLQKINLSLENNIGALYHFSVDNKLLSSQDESLHIFGAKTNVKSSKFYTGNNIYLKENNHQIFKLKNNKINTDQAEFKTSLGNLE